MSDGDSTTDSHSDTDSDLVVREDDLEWTDYEPDEDHSFRRKQLGAAAGSEEIGVSRYSVEPEKETWHHHYHTANEEGLYVLEGSGIVRLGPDEEEISLDPGTYVTFPADERGAHSIQAGEDGLELLMFSGMNEPDVAVYPDEDMVGLYVGSPPGGDSKERTLPNFLDLDSAVDYWE